MKEPVPLKVLAVICRHYWMERHLLPTLQATFQNVEVFFYEGMAKWDDPAWVAGRPGEMRRLLAAARSLKSAGKLDLLFMIVYDDFLSAEAAAAIRALGVRLVNYHVDMHNQWYRCIRTAPYFDLIGAAHRDHFEALSRYRGRLLYLPMAANADHFRPLGLAKEYDVLFVGSYTPPRADALAAATDVTKSVYVAGSGWEEPPLRQDATPVSKRVSWRKYLYDLPYLLPRFLADGTRMFAPRNLGARTYAKGGKRGGARSLGWLADPVEAVNKARIVLGISQRDGSIGSKGGHVQSLLRDFEVPSCGSTYLVQRYSELGNHYVENGEVAAWSTLDELRAQINELLTHEKKREAIARAGRQRVLESHQWRHRYLSLCAHLQLLR